MDQPVTPASGDAIERLAELLLGAMMRGEPVERPLLRGGLAIDDAYRVSAAIAARRTAAGATRRGRKFGFTNRAIWAQYGVASAIIGDMFDTTVAFTDGSSEVALSALCEPRLEPEIVLGLGADPTGGPEDLAAAVVWVALGVEVVHSVFPGWIFEAGEAIAAGGLHGRLIVGPRVMSDAPGFDDLVRGLADVELVACKDGSEVARGVGRNALDGPLEALAHAVDILAAQPDHPPIAAGECVTTGTLTDAFPVATGETWRVSSSGDVLPALTVRFVG